MRSITLRILALLICFANSSHLSSMEKIDTVSVGFANFPPYSIEAGFTTFAPTSARCQTHKTIGYGIDVDFLEAVLREAGIRYQTNFYPQARLTLLLKHKRIDVTASLFYSDNNDAYRYIQYDIGGATTFYAHTDIAQDIMSFEDIRDHTLGVVRNESFHHDELNAWAQNAKSTKVIVANDYDHLFLMLEKRRVELIATNDILGAYIAKKRSLNRIVQAPFIIPYGTDPKHDGIYIATQRDFPEQQFAKLEQATKKLLSERALDCIKERYGISPLSPVDY